MSAFFDAGRRVLSSSDQEVGMKEVAPTAAGHARVISGSVKTEIPMGENRHGPQERGTGCAHHHRLGKGSLRRHCKKFLQCMFFVPILYMNSDMRHPFTSSMSSRSLLRSPSWARTFSIWPNMFSVFSMMT